MEFTKDKYMKLRKAHNSATSSGKSQFMFEGQVILTSYSKYLLEYLNMRFGK